MKLLIVDDSRMNRIYASSLIEKNHIDLDVHFADSGEAALAKMAEVNIDIVLLDIIMPGIDGVETLERIMRDISKEIKVLMYSTISDSSALERCFKLGAVDFIHKPLEEIEFIARLKSVIRQKYLENEKTKYIKKIEAQKMIITDTNLQLMQKEKLAGIGQLAAGVAHEINNPLGFITSNFAVLKDYVKKFYLVYGLFEGQLTNDEMVAELKRLIDDEDFRFIFEDLEELFSETDIGLKRVTDIVKSLRNFSRIDNNENLEMYNINDGIKDTLIIANNHVKYHVDVETHLGEVPNIDAIGGQINQVLLNIVVNASDAIQAKHHNNKGKLEIRTQEKDGYVIASFKDNGVGIDDEHKASLFNPFFTTKPVGKGMGLGLSMSYDIIVNKHFGKIDVNSQPGEGTEFLIYLPINGNIRN